MIDDGLDFSHLSMSFSYAKVLLGTYQLLNLRKL